MRNHRNDRMESIEEDRTHGGILFRSHLRIDHPTFLGNSQVASYKMKRRLRDWEHHHPYQQEHQSYYGDIMVTDDSEFEEDEEDDSISLIPAHHHKNSKRIRFTPKPKQPWWKQQLCSTTTTNPVPPQHVFGAHTPQCCFICQSSISSSNCHPHTKSELSHVDSGNVNHDTSNSANRKAIQKNSLLSYFKPKTTISSCISKNSSNLQPNQQQKTLVACSYCDRLACNPACVQTCESCTKLYCTFCSTINYDGPTERTFCLDCSHQLPTSTSNDDDNRMEE
jgi:hypothetical protein